WAMNCKFATSSASLRSQGTMRPSSSNTTTAFPVLPGTDETRPGSTTPGSSVSCSSSAHGGTVAASQRRLIASRSKSLAITYLLVVPISLPLADLRDRVDNRRRVGKSLVVGVAKRALLLVVNGHQPVDRLVAPPRHAEVVREHLLPVLETVLHAQKLGCDEAFAQSVHLS